MMAMLVNGILDVGEVIPDRIGQKLELVAFWPARNLCSMAVIFSDYFLQKDQVWCRLPEFTANRFQRITAVTDREPLVDVQRQNPEIDHTLAL